MAQSVHVGADVRSSASDGRLPHAGPIQSYGAKYNVVPMDRPIRAPVHDGCGVDAGVPAGYVVFMGRAHKLISIRGFHRCPRVARLYVWGMVPRGDR